MNRHIEWFDVIALFRSTRLRIATVSGVIAWILYSYWMIHVDGPSPNSLSGDAEFWPFIVYGDVPWNERWFWVRWVELVNFLVKVWSVTSFAWLCQHLYARRGVRISMSSLLAATGILAVICTIISYSGVVYQLPAAISQRKIEFFVPVLPLTIAMPYVCTAAGIYTMGIFVRNRIYPPFDSLEDSKRERENSPIDG